MAAKNTGKTPAPKPTSSKTAKAAVTAAGQTVSSARKAALKEVEARIERLEGGAYAHDGSQVKVSIPVDETAPAPTGSGDGSGGSARQDHEVPSEKELANNAAHGAHADKGRAEQASKKAGGKKSAKAAKPAIAPKEKKPAKPKRMGVLDAAAQVLAASKEPMRASDMITAVEAKGLWKSPGGKTPEATLYAAIIREIAAKGNKARFKKHDRGVFVATPHAGKEV